MHIQVTNTVSEIESAVAFNGKLLIADRLMIDFVSGNCTSDMECIAVLVDAGYKVIVAPVYNNSHYEVRGIMTEDGKGVVIWNARKGKR